MDKQIFGVENGIIHNKIMFNDKQKLINYVITK